MLSNKLLTTFFFLAVLASCGAPPDQAQGHLSSASNAVIDNLKAERITYFGYELSSMSAFEIIDQNYGILRVPSGKFHLMHLDTHQISDKPILQRPEGCGGLRKIADDTVVCTDYGQDRLINYNVFSIDPLEGTEKLAFATKNCDRSAPLTKTSVFCEEVHDESFSQDWVRLETRGPGEPFQDTKTIVHYKKSYDAYSISLNSNRDILYGEIDNIIYPSEKLQLFMSAGGYKRTLSLEPWDAKSYLTPISLTNDKIFGFLSSDSDHEIWELVWYPITNDGPTTVKASKTSKQLCKGCIPRSSMRASDRISIVMTTDTKYESRSLLVFDSERQEFSQIPLNLSSKRLAGVEQLNDRFALVSVENNSQQKNECFITDLVDPSLKTIALGNPQSAPCIGKIRNQNDFYFTADPKKRGFDLYRIDLSTVFH